MPKNTILAHSHWSLRDLCGIEENGKKRDPNSPGLWSR
jgi:hypothetical protein